MKYIFFVLIITCCFSCSQQVAEQQVTIENSIDKMGDSTSPEQIQETTSFTGKPLYQGIISAEMASKSDSIIQVYLNKQSQLTEEEYIYFSSAHVSSLQYRKAVEILTEGLSKYPNSFKLLRQRGHRYINLRELDKAIIDLNKADELIGTEHLDVMETRANGELVGTYKFKVYYHIGLYHYLRGEYEESAKAYEVCLENATIGDNQVETRDWLYNAYQKAGETEKALKTIEPITPDFQLEHPDYVYFKRILMYKGLVSPDELLDKDKPGSEWNGREMTNAYGVSTHYLYQGDTATANMIHQKILETPYWGLWAYVAADADLARLK